jgi:predicted Rossmann-fold nucleotide-binding protein
MRICVFCGSHAGNNEIYVSAAREMGRSKQGVNH